MKKSILFLCAVSVIGVLAMGCGRGDTMVDDVEEM